MPEDCGALPVDIVDSGYLDRVKNNRNAARSNDSGAISPFIQPTDFALSRSVAQMIVGIFISSRFLT